MRSVRALHGGWIAAAALSILFTLAGASSARAQESQAPPQEGSEEQWVISAAAGGGTPAGGWFSTDWKRGISILLSLAREVNPHLELGAEFGYNKFQPDGDTVSVPGITHGEKDWEFWRIRFRGRRMLVSEDAKIAPFVMAGFGIYPITVSSEDSTGIYKVTLTGLGASVGGGVDFRAGEAVHFGLEGQYHYVKTDPAIVTYKAAPMVEVVFAIRWLPG
jgi:hypothetical protein